MAIKVSTQKDYLRTESTVVLPASVAEVDEQLRGAKTSGKMVVLYNNGHIQGINIEQNSKMTEAQSTETRVRLGVSDLLL
jgi:hypothetical protein